MTITYTSFCLSDMVKMKCYSLFEMRNGVFKGYFLLFIGLPSHSVDFCLMHRILKFDEAQFITFSFIVCAFGVTSSKSLPNPMYEAFPLFFP